MARRSRDWNEGFAEDLRDKMLAREFLLGAIEEGVAIQVALGKVIRAINPRHNPTQEALNRLLRPFRLRLSLAPIERRRPTAA
ncbi:MAG TPA: hypothetical protein VGK32_08625 [Vicinamibacterales bacterium]